MHRLKYALLIIFILCFITAGCSGNNNIIGVNSEPEADSLLILVNKDNKLPDDYNIKLAEIDNFKIAEILINDLKEMQEAAAGENYIAAINAAYRTIEEQQQILDNMIVMFINNGDSQEEALEKTTGLAAPPGYSEHHTGLAVDFTNEGTYDERLKMWDWLSRNAYKYGFILRYPSGKEDITGYDYEAWHYRYVGRKHAKEIFDSNVVLEEYLDTLK